MGVYENVRAQSSTASGYALISISNRLLTMIAVMENVAFVFI